MLRSRPGAHSNVRWSEIQNLLNNVSFDCLLLLDCLYATQAATRALEGMFDELPKRIQLLAGSGANTETNLSMKPSFTAVMASVMSADIQEHGHVDLLNLFIKLSNRKFHLHKVPSRFSGLSTRRLKLQKPTWARNERDGSLPRKVDSAVTSASPPLLELDSQSGGGYTGYVPSPSLDRTRSKLQSSAFDSIHRFPNVYKDMPPAHLDSMWQSNSASIGHLVQEAVPPTVSTPTDGKTGFEHRFSQRLTTDLGYNIGLKSMKGFPRFEFVSILRGFAGRLHEEATTSSYLELSVALHRKSE